MPIWTYLGDALWVLALSIMFSASRRASTRIPADVKALMMGARVPRGLALWALPGASFLLSLWFALQARELAPMGDPPFFLFCVRAILASLVGQLHIRWLRNSLTTLEREGQLKP